MRPEEYAKMYDQESTYWWFQGRKDIVAQLLDALPATRRADARFLDIGCGTGLILDYMSKRHWCAGLDFSPLALAFSRKRGAARLVRADVQKMPIAGGALDVVTALDLAEHVERDDALWAEVHRTLKSDGRLVLTVPAHPFLWSDHDDALYHFRRYTRRELRSKLLDAGFEIERMSYCITLTFPAIVAFRLFQRMLQKRDRPKTHLIALPRWANSLLIASVRFEAFLLRHCNLPIGVTLLAVARKKAS